MVKQLNYQLNPIDNTTITTSVGFISICIALVVFIKKFPLQPQVMFMSLIFLFITITLFSISGIFSYVAVAKITCKLDDVFSVKFIAYMLGITLFAVSSAIIIFIG